jgi:hypothetical protein
MDFFETWVIGTSTSLGRVPGDRDTLDVATGTGLNLPHYRKDARLTGEQRLRCLSPRRPYGPGEPLCDQPRI